VNESCHAQVPNVVTYSALIASCRHGDRWVKAFEILLDMVQHDIQPDAMTFNALLGVCQSSCQWYVI